MNDTPRTKETNFLPLVPDGVAKKGSARKMLRPCFDEPSERRAKKKEEKKVKGTRDFSLR